MLTGLSNLKFIHKDKGHKESKTSLSVGEKLLSKLSVFRWCFWVTRALPKREVQLEWVWKWWASIRVEKDLREQYSKFYVWLNFQKLDADFCIMYMFVIFFMRFLPFSRSGIGKQPVGQIWSIASFYKTFELRMFFTFSNDCKETKAYLVVLKLYEIQILVSINIYWWTTTFIHLCVICVRYKLQRQSCIVATETVWPVKSKVLAVWPFKVCQPLHEIMKRSDFTDLWETFRSLRIYTFFLAYNWYSVNFEFIFIRWTNQQKHIL